MTQTEIFLNLFKCAINGQPFCLKDTVDLEALPRFAERHDICATIAPALLDSGIITDTEQHDDWRERRYKCVGKTLTFDSEREKIYRALDSRGVWYAPLKGIVVNRLYPIYGTREFADNDILVDEKVMDRVEEAMISLGYHLEDASDEIHIAYHKPSTLNFEMHFRLFPDDEAHRLMNRYFRSVYPDGLIKGDSPFACSLSDEHQYLYIMAHAYSHYVLSGIGLRTLSDIYLYRKQIPMNESVVIRGLKAMQITAFADRVVSLSNALFEGEEAFAFQKLDEAEKQFLEEIVRLGTFGTVSSFYLHRYREFIEKDGAPGRWAYIRYRLFPSIEVCRKQFPTIYRHKVLHPLFYLYRPIRGVLFGRKAIMRERKAISREDKKNDP